MDKARLRTLLSRRLRAVHDEEIISASHAVCERLINVTSWREIGAIHVYTAVAKWHEIDLSEFMGWVRDAHPLVNITIGSPEPDAVLPGTAFDLIIVPLLGFDEKCHRLGRGRGWYDNFLASQPDAMKVGAALERQKFDMIPTEPHDVTLDTVVTENGIY